MSRERAPYGSWRSPIAAADIAAAGIRLGEIKTDGDAIYWIERRPAEGGRNALVKHTRGNGAATDVIPAEWSARTMVHEYGGGNYAVRDGIVVFANFADQRLYLTGTGDDRTPQPLTLEPPEPRSVRYADIAIHPSGTFAVAVRETHAGAEVTTDLVAVGLTGDHPGVTVVAEGHDFYSSPRFSPAGDRLVWLTWDHPRMPWDGTDLWLADVDVDDRLATNVQHVTGSTTESIVQPEWSPDGVLHYVSDRTGWWNLYALGDDRPIVERDAEFGGPHWVFGLTYYAFLPDGRIAATYAKGGTSKLCVIDPATHQVDDVATPYTDISYVTVAGDEIVFAGGSPTEPHVVTTSKGQVLRSSAAPPDPAYVSVPEAIEFPTTHGATAHAFLYRPVNPRFEAPPGERPPLVVIGHGGPTSSTRTTYETAVQFWTTRGIAVVDVNYRGSTGYGRPYRDALKGTWGVADVDDCIAAARYVADRGDADGHRLVIRGASAGGYTVLRALTTTKDFAAAASFFGVADLEVLAQETHKFEARYLDGLVAPYPERRDVYVERSPIHVADRITAPLLVLQGLDDAVVPPSQSQMIVAALTANGVPVEYIEFEGEGHGFRKAETIVRCAGAELSFYGRHLGFTPAS